MQNLLQKSPVPYPDIIPSLLENINHYWEFCENYSLPSLNRLISYKMYSKILFSLIYLELGISQLRRHTFCLFQSILCLGGSNHVIENNSKLFLLLCVPTYFSTLLLMDRFGLLLLTVLCKNYCTFPPGYMHKSCV